MNKIDHNSTRVPVLSGVFVALCLTTALPSVTESFTVAWLVPLVAAIIATAVSAAYGRDSVWFMSRSLIVMTCAVFLTLPWIIGPVHTTILGMVLVLIAVRDFFTVASLAIIAAVYPDFYVASSSSVVETVIQYLCIAGLAILIAVNVLNSGKSLGAQNEENLTQ